MIFNFTTHVKKGTRCYISIPYKLCTEHNIKLKDVILAKINNYEFFGYVTGTNSSKRINLPLKIFQQLSLGKNNIVIEKLPERKSELIIFNNQIDLYFSLPNKIKHYDWPLVITKNQEKITVWSPQAYPHTIPRYLKLDEELFELFGLFQGEGYKKTPVGGTRIGFVNSDKEIINYVLKHLNKKLDISISQWSAFINYVYSGEQPSKIENKLIQEWSQKTKIHSNNFKRVNYLRGKGIRSAKSGTLHIFIPQCVLGEIYLNILEIIEKLSTEKEKYAAAFLRGLMAADGSATLQKHKHYQTIRIAELAVESTHEKELYNNILKKLGLNIKDYSFYNRKLCICGWDDFLKLAKIDAFRLHKTKRNNFKIGFQNHKQTRMIKKYLSPLFKEKLSANQLMEKLKLKSQGSLLQTLQTQIKRGLVERKKIENEYKYYLTKKGGEILEFLLNY